MRSRAIARSFMAIGFVATMALHTSGDSTTATADSDSEITYSRRLRAFEEVLRFYHQHQVGSGGSFDLLWPIERLAARVDRAARLEHLLRDRWGVRISSEMLQRETDRVAGATLLPGRLRQLYARLGNDPRLIQETFVRAQLVERLAGSAFRFDPQIHAESRDRALRMVGDDPSRFRESETGFDLLGDHGRPVDRVEKVSFNDWWSREKARYPSDDVRSVATTSSTLT
jgi:hypothetical protein